MVYDSNDKEVGQKCYFHKIYFVVLPQLALSVEIVDPISHVGARQLALSVEIVDPISLCWGLANLHCL